MSEMFETCIHKQDKIKQEFSTCKTQEEVYQKIIFLGRALPPLAPDHKIPENLVKGCQSQMFLHTTSKDEKVHFIAESDALISSGLAALLVRAYSGETPECILKCPPNFLEELSIPSILTPNRANGLYSLHLRMKQEALKLIVT